MSFFYNFHWKSICFFLYGMNYFSKIKFSKFYYFTATFSSCIEKFEGSLTQHSNINIYTAYFGILKHVDYLLKMFIKKLKERLRCVRPLLIFYCEWRSNEKRVSVGAHNKFFFYYFSKYTKNERKKTDPIQRTCLSCLW